MNASPNPKWTPYLTLGGNSNKEKVGITLTASAGGTVTQITENMWAVNEPSKLIFLIPAGLPNSEYTLRVTTQFSGSTRLLKVPNTVEQTI